ncbi:hypothetical protein Tco_0422002 [Tanacetum coccineum]
MMKRVAGCGCGGEWVVEMATGGGGGVQSVVVIERARGGSVAADMGIGQRFRSSVTLKSSSTDTPLEQLDEDWFTLDANLLREDLEITPIHQARHFESPPSGNAIMDFVNELGYPEELHFVSRMDVNNLYQPWRVIFLMINQCLTSKTSRKHNINQRSGSSFNMAEVDHHLGNLKFVPKGEEDEVFGMQIPKELITDNIRNASYYNAYLEMAAKHDRKITVEEGGKTKSASKTNQSKKPATAKQPKPMSSKQSKPAPAKQPKPLVDEEEQAQPEPEPKPQGEEEDYDLQRGIQMSLESFQPPVGGVAFREPASGITPKLPTVEGKGKGIDIVEQVAQSLLELQMPKKKSTTDHEGDTEILNIGEEQGEDVADKVDLEEKTAEFDEGQAGSDPGKTPESRPPPEHTHIEEYQAGPNPGQSHVALAGPNPKPMHEDFVATVYPQVHESLKHPDEEHVHLENLVSSTRTLSSMKNLDNFTFGDQFIVDKSSKDEQRNANMETEVDSMVTVPIHQASSSVPPFSTLVVDFSTPKPISSPVQAPTFTATTATKTTTLPLQPLPQQQSSSDPDLASRVLALETICANFEKRYKLKDKTVQGLLSMIFISQPEHVALYKALEASMKRDNRGKLLAENDKLRKRRRDDQDPPLPPTKESEQSKKKKQDSDALDSEDTGVSHLPKIKTKPNWLKPIPKEDRPETPEPDWVIPPNDLPEPENNWANAFATSYKDPEENKLLQKTSDMGSFIRWYYRRIGKLKLSKADLEGPAYKVVSAFHSNNISLQYQIEECHLLLIDQIDLANPEGHRVVPNMSKPLPLRGPPGQLKETNYPDFGLEELVPSLWIESEHEYDVSAAYKISHWWFKRNLKTYSRYGYTYLKEIVLRRADYNEYKISEFDFKNLHPNDLKTFNLWISNIVIRKRVEDLQLGTLTRILEKLDYMVKDFKLFKYNLGMEKRIWSEDDRRRSKELWRSDTYTGNPVKEILVNLNLPDHRLVLTDPEMEMEIPRSNGVNFITTCSYSFKKSKDIMKAQVYVSKLPQL